MEKIAITNNPVISAIYFALLQCGYDYYALERNEEHIRAVEALCQSAVLPPFFSEVKQSTCEVYPYWPRAAMLETASFYLNSEDSGFADFEKYRDRSWLPGILPTRSGITISGTGSLISRKL